MKADCKLKLEQMYEIDMILFMSQEVPRLTGIEKLSKKKLAKSKNLDKKLSKT